MKINTAILFIYTKLTKISMKYLECRRLLF